MEDTPFAPESQSNEIVPKICPICHTYLFDPITSALLDRFLSIEMELAEVRRLVEEVLQ